MVTPGSGMRASEQHRTDGGEHAVRREDPPWRTVPIASDERQAALRYGWRREGLERADRYRTDAKCISLRSVDISCAMVADG